MLFFVRWKCSKMEKDFKGKKTMMNSLTAEKKGKQKQTRKQNHENYVIGKFSIRLLFAFLLRIIALIKFSVFSSMLVKKNEWDPDAQIEHVQQLIKLTSFQQLLPLTALPCSFVPSTAPILFASSWRSFERQSVTPTALAIEWKSEENVKKKDNKFSCMIHRISLNACHFMAWHKVQQDLCELIFFSFASSLLASKCRSS